MKILVHHLGTRGGGPQLQLAISKALLSFEDVEVFIAFDVATEVGSQLRALNVPLIEFGTHVGGMGRLRLPLRLAAQLSDAIRLRRVCIKNRFDVVYEPMGHPLQVLPRWLSRRAGVRFLTSIHDATRHPGEENRLLAWLGRRDLVDTDAVITYSAAVAAKLPRLDVPVFQTVHGAFGHFRAQGARAYPGGTPVIGFFGRIGKYKGLERLRDAAVALRARGCLVELHIIGRGSLDPEVEKDFRALNTIIDNRWVRADEIPSIIDSFDVLALPYDEASQSGVVGFALNAGVPIVATPVGGLSEQVRESGGSVAVDMSAAAFADAVENLLSSPEAYDHVSNLQLSAVKQRFSWDRVAADILRAARAVSRSPLRRRL